MKKYILILSWVMTSFCYAQNEAYTVMAKSDGSLVIPDKSTFFEKNVKVFQQDFRIFVDTTPSPENSTMEIGVITIASPFYYKDSAGKVKRLVDRNGDEITTYTPSFKHYQIRWWTDCEVKVIDKWGNLVYFTSTIALSNKQVQMLHPDFCDSTPIIYAWFNEYENSTGGCWGRKDQHTNFDASIGESIGSAITGIWIYPSIDSTDKRRIPIFTGANVYSMQAVVWGTYVREVFNNPENTILVWRQTLSSGEYFNGNKLWRPARLEYYGDFKEVK